jgi:hypothetical protein
MRITTACLALSILAAPTLHATTFSGNVGTTGTGTTCGLNTGATFPTTVTPVTVGKTNYVQLTSTLLGFNTNSTGGINSYYFQNYLITFNTTASTYSIQIASGSSVATLASGAYKGTIAPDSYVSYHIAATLDCGLTLTGEVSGL